MSKQKKIYAVMYCKSHTDGVPDIEDVEVDITGNKCEMVWADSGKCESPIDWGKGWGKCTDCGASYERLVDTPYGDYKLSDLEKRQVEKIL